jgi:hypothetical protein
MDPPGLRQGRGPLYCAPRQKAQRDKTTHIVMVRARMGRTDSPVIPAPPQSRRLRTVSSWTCCQLMTPARFGSGLLFPHRHGGR